jgi:hypothetical protein
MERFVLTFDFLPCLREFELAPIAADSSQDQRRPDGQKREKAQPTAPHLTQQQRRDLAHEAASRHQARRAAAVGHTGTRCTIPAMGIQGHGAMTGLRLGATSTGATRLPLRGARRPFSVEAWPVLAPAGGFAGHSDRPPPIAHGFCAPHLKPHASPSLRPHPAPSPI